MTPQESHRSYLSGASILVVDKTMIETNCLRKKWVASRDTWLHFESMGRAFGFLSVIVVVAVGGYFYMNQIQAVTPGGSTPKVTIDVTAVRNDLLAHPTDARGYLETDAKSSYQQY